MCFLWKFCPSSIIFWWTDWIPEDNSLSCSSLWPPGTQPHSRVIRHTWPWPSTFCRVGDTPCSWLQWPVSSPSHLSCYHEVWAGISRGRWAPSMMCGYFTGTWENCLEITFLEGNELTNCLKQLRSSGLYFQTCSKIKEAFSKMCSSELLFLETGVSWSSQHVKQGVLYPYPLPSWSLLCQER